MPVCYLSTHIVESANKAARHTYFSSVGTNGVSVYEHADGYMPALLVWEYPIDTVWTHVAVVYHNGRPSLYINGVWKKDGLQSLRQHLYPCTQFPGGGYGSQGDGILDEVRIWSVARTEAQIAANKDKR